MRSILLITVSKAGGGPGPAYFSVWNCPALPLLACPPAPWFHVISEQDKLATGKPLCLCLQSRFYYLPAVRPQISISITLKLNFLVHEVQSFGKYLSSAYCMHILFWVVEINRIDKTPALFSAPSTGQRAIKQKDNFRQYQILRKKWNKVMGQVSESRESRLHYSVPGRPPWGGDIWAEIYY